MDLPPDYATKSHDESETRPAGALRRACAAPARSSAGEERFPLDPEHLVRVNAGIDRVLTSGPDGLRVLCIGGVPGGAYVAPEWTELTQPARERQLGAARGERLR